MATDTLTHATAHAHEHGHHDAGQTKIFGFWIYLMSDCILFSILFATYAVLVNGTAGGPTLLRQYFHPYFDHDVPHYPRQCAAKKRRQRQYL